MAEVQRKRTLVNPARRRKRRNRARRKMTAKQIRHFGTKRQKAALKASRKRKRTNRARRHAPRTNAAPRRSRRARRAARPKHRRRTRRANPGGIVEVALNPAPRRRKKVAATRKRRRKSHSRRRSNVRHRRNPAPMTHRRRRRSTGHRRNRRRSVRRNPSMGGVSNLIVQAAYAVGGAVGSKYLTQMVLGAANTGYVGYAANLAASFVGGKLVGMFTRNKAAENSVILGGVIMTLVRFLSDQTPLGETLKTAGFGDYEASTWLSPARYIDAAKSAAVDIPTALRPQIMAAKGMAGMGGGTYARGRGTY
jgi:hypothetical protein